MALIIEVNSSLRLPKNLALNVETASGTFQILPESAKKVATSANVPTISVVQSRQQQQNFFEVFGCDGRLIVRQEVGNIYLRGITVRIDLPANLSADASTALSVALTGNALCACKTKKMSNPHRLLTIIVQGERKVFEGIIPIIKK